MPHGGVRIGASNSRDLDRRLHEGKHRVGSHVRHPILGCSFLDCLRNMPWSGEGGACCPEGCMAPKRDHVRDKLLAEVLFLGMGNWRLPGSLHDCSLFGRDRTFPDQEKDHPKAEGGIDAITNPGVSPRKGVNRAADKVSVRIPQHDLSTRTCVRHKRGKFQTTEKRIRS